MERLSGLSNRGKFKGRLQTLFIIAGVAIGVGVIVFMSAMLSGLQSNFIRRVLSAQAHIELLPPQEVARPQRRAERGDIDGPIIQPPLQRLKGIDQWQAVAAQIQSMPEVLVTSPVAGGSALAVRGAANRSITIAGIEPEQYFRIVDINDKLVRGSTRLSATDILIGTELASALGVDVGDKLRLSTANGAASTLTISGISDLGSKGANQRNSFVTLHTAQSLLEIPGAVTSLEVTVNDVYAAQAIAQRITTATGVEADNLDAKSADSVFDMLRRLNRENGTTVLFVTHNAALAGRCDKTIEVVDGLITG